MLYIEKGICMRIDSTSPQPHRINELPSQQTKEVPGEKEPDGDWDDMTGKAATTVKSAMTPSAPQINPQGVGTKVNLLE
jgi:hypothetical protein